VPLLAIWNIQAENERLLFQTVEEIITIVHRVCDDLRSVFFNWIERFEQVSEHKGEDYTNSHKKIS
jgi:hypothetical protein